MLYLETMYKSAFRVTSYLSQPLRLGCYKAYLTQVFNLHGIPKTIILDWDKIFIILFWKEIMLQLRTTVALSTTYHTETEGQLQCLKQCLKQYLRCMCFFMPKTWSSWLHLAEWQYNTNLYSTIVMSPFWGLYKYQPLVCLGYF